MLLLKKIVLVYPTTFFSIWKAQKWHMTGTLTQNSRLGGNFAGTGVVQGWRRKPAPTGADPLDSGSTGYVKILSPGPFVDPLYPTHPPTPPPPRPGIQILNRPLLKICLPKAAKRILPHITHKIDQIPIFTGLFSKLL